MAQRRHHAEATNCNSSAKRRDRRTASSWGQLALREGGGDEHVGSESDAPIIGRTFIVAFQRAPEPSHSECGVHSLSGRCDRPPPNEWDFSSQSNICSCREADANPK